MSEAWIPESEDQETLDAIDRGIRDAKAGRFVMSEEARRLVAQWIAELAARKPR
jgi:predicted transcriptional regulator